MNFEIFKELAKKYKVVPVFEKITADMLTPVLVYLKIREKDKNCFLLESVEGIGRLARYSFIGKDPYKLFYNFGKDLHIKTSEKDDKLDVNIFDFLKNEIKNSSHPLLEDLPYFTGGIVGYLGYESVSAIEDVIKFDQNDNLENPDSIFGVYKTILAFDHYKHQLIIISNVFVNENDKLETLYDKAKENISSLKKELKTQVEFKSDFDLKSEIDDPYIDKENFFSLVEKCKENIFNGDVFQIVLSRRFNTEYSGDLLNVYRALRMINPSPYMYFLEYENDFTIIGTSPEDLLKVQDNNATILPIAGTRKRGNTEEEDKALEIELLNDPKELAEHNMLIDLARNDLGRVCEFDSVHLSENMNITRFSHVMHIVSRVEGNLQDSKNCIDALKASFPAGTVTGAPKIRAIQLLNEYEEEKRNVYAGAVGYIDFSGNLDMCIAIRTMFAKKNKIYWQAGAGIVADSQPKLELKEIKNKAAALRSALKYAEVIDENIDD